MSGVFIGIFSGEIVFFFFNYSIVNLLIQCHRESTILERYVKFVVGVFQINNSGNALRT